MFQVPWAIALGTWNIFLHTHTVFFAVLTVWVGVWDVLCTSKVLYYKMLVFRYKTR